jgi:ABC-type transporter Mla subunit MlaD
VIRRVLTAVVVLGSCVAALVLTGASENGGKGGKEVRIVLDNAFGLVEGGDLKVGGVRAGQTTSFDITDTDPPKSVAVAELTEPGFDSFRKDARCEVRQQSLIGEYFIDCQPGSSKEPLPNNTVPVEQTSSTIPLDLINNIQRRPYRERLRLIISDLGAGLAGRPEDLNEVIRRAHPGLRETSKTLEILGRQNKIIQDFIVNSDTVVAELERNKQDVARWVEEAGETAEISATRREALAEQFRRFPGFLDELEPTMARLGDLTDAQTPLLREARAAAPDLETFFEELGPFAESSRPSLRSLAKTSKAGRAAIDESRDEIAELNALAQDAPRFAKPLRQFLQALDDRNRYHERDDRHKQTAPPAPDKTAAKDGAGWTGMEAVWNYVFWQTLAINPFDELTHFLRAVGQENPECGSYNHSPSEEEIKHCNRWLGPYQPGVTHPDPTDKGEAARIAARERELERTGGERKAGDPKASEPKAGERDLSKPQITLPPELEELVKKLQQDTGAQELPKLPEQLPPLPQQLPQGTPQVPGVNGDGQVTAPEQLLDFLLAP